MACPADARARSRERWLARCPYRKCRRHFAKHWNNQACPSKTRRIPIARRRFPWTLSAMFSTSANAGSCEARVGRRIHKLTMRVRETSRQARGELTGSRQRGVRSDGAVHRPAKSRRRAQPSPARRGERWGHPCSIRDAFVIGCSTPRIPSGYDEGLVPSARRHDRDIRVVPTR
jgi:hypothetical protein